MPFTDTRMIYHITTERGWQIAREMGEYRAESLKTEGFIHCSTEEQVSLVVSTFYQDVPNLVLLGIDPDKLSAPLAWEAPVHPAGTESPIIGTFPHIYGAINLDAVVSILPLPEFLDRVTGG